MGTVVPVTPGHVAQTEREALDGEGGEDSRVGREALLQSVLKVRRLLPATPQLHQRLKPTVRDGSTRAPHFPHIPFLTPSLCEETAVVL